MPHGLTVRGRKIAKSTTERRMKSSSRTATELPTSRLSGIDPKPGMGAFCTSNQRNPRMVRATCKPLLTLFEQPAPPLLTAQLTATSSLLTAVPRSRFPPGDPLEYRRVIRTSRPCPRTPWRRRFGLCFLQQYARVLTRLARFACGHHIRRAAESQRR